jgi:hypothetical protein
MTTAMNIAVRGLFATPAGGKHTGQIFEIAKGMAHQFAADWQSRTMRPAWRVEAWANVNGPGDGNICHYHPASFWSGTYCVDEGGCAPRLATARRVVQANVAGATIMRRRRAWPSRSRS